MSQHLCHARNCTTPVAPKYLMCRKHWRLVPAELKIDKRPSREYIQAARAAITAVFQIECDHVNVTITNEHNDGQLWQIWLCRDCRLREAIQLH